jgi:hypothetical protein
MDKETVLQIIAMLDIKIAKLREEFDNPAFNEYELGYYLQGQIIGFNFFRDQLQECIKIQVLQKEGV